MSFWKEYSLNYIKNNKASTISIITAAFIASLFLSLLCGIFFNIWKDDIRLIKAQEGDWHAKITAELTAKDIEIIRNHPDVKNVVIAEAGIKFNTAILYFYHARQVYEKLPVIVEQIGMDNTAVIEYHDKLLARYFVYAKGHNPPTVIFVYLGTLLAASVSLILIIHNAFGVSMLARLQQLAVLQSIGATPRQLRSALVNEAVLLCLIPVFTGTLAGYGSCYLFVSLMKKLVHSVRNTELIFQYHPTILLLAFAISVLTVWFSVLIPARKLSRLSPLEAIRYEGDQSIDHMKRFFIISRLLGTEGELARKSLYTRRETFRTATISITLSFLAFSAFLNIETISGLSTQYSFFERYKNVWDMMLTMQRPEDQQKKLLTEIRNIQGVRSCIAYQKATAYTEIDDNMLSREIEQLGGLEKLKNTGIQYDGKQYMINAPLIILDDQSFYNYCLKIGANPDVIIKSEFPETVVVNSIWDNINSNRRNRKMLPLIRIKEDMSLKLMPYEKKEGYTMEGSRVIVAAATDKLPGIREGFDDFSMIQVMSASIYKRLNISLPADEYFYTIVANSENDIGIIENSIRKLLDGQENYKLENKLATEKADVNFRKAYIVAIGSLTGLLICIGLANVLSNALGIFYQRKREFSRYITIGLSPKGVLRLLMLEAAILALRPILISLLVNIPIVLLSLNASFITLDEFMQNIPIIPVLTVAAVIISTVMTSYYIGGKRLYKVNWVDALRDDTLVG